MICPLCSRDTPTTIVCLWCRGYMHSRVESFKATFETKTRTGLFYLTVAATDYPQKTITAEKSATIKMDGNHEFIEVITSVDGVPITNKVKAGDHYISRSNALVLAEDEGKIKVTQSAEAFTLNGSNPLEVNYELTEGDVIFLSPFTYLKYDVDIEHPAAVPGALSLAPEGFNAEKYDFTYNGKKFIDGVHNDLLAFLRISAKMWDKVAVTRYNRHLLGPDYRTIVGKGK